MTQVSFSGNTLNLAWTGDSTSYKVQSTPGLAKPSWVGSVNTARTNIVLPVVGDSAFFRVVPADTNQSSVVLTVTNMTSGDVITFTNVAQTNADLVFNGPANWNDSGLQVQMVFPAAELQKFDIAVDNQGGFVLVTNGQSFGWGGSLTSTPGPGTNQITFTGYATNYTGAYTISAITDPDDWGVFGGLIGSMCWLICQPGFALQGIGCASACSSKAFECALQLKFSYCNFVTSIDGSGILTNNVNCIANCQTGCK